MFHHCNHPIRFGHFEHLELPRRCIVTWHLLAANSKLVENFEPSSEYSLWCWQQRKIVSEYSQLACEWLLPWQEIRLKALQPLLPCTRCQQCFTTATIPSSSAILNISNCHVVVLWRAWHLLAANRDWMKILNQAASTRCGAGNKEKLSASTRSWLASGFCHDRKFALRKLSLQTSSVVFF